MPEHEPQVEQWNYEALRTRLLAACREGKPGIAPFERLPRSIDFGKMVERLLAIRRDNDITAHEYSLDVVYDPHTDSLRQSKQEIRGEQFKAAFQPKLIGRESVLSKLRLHEQVE